MNAYCRRPVDHDNHSSHSHNHHRSALLLAGLLAVTGHVHATDLDLLIENVQNTEGRILVSLYRSAETFLQKAAYTQIVSADRTNGAGKVLVRFHEIPAGTYAAAVIHDRDGDGKLSTNLLGIPREPYGFSSGARGRFGPPSFQDAAFSWPATTGTSSAKGTGAASPSTLVTVRVE
jgi:uncharacterized protein (DUF2141 family)